MSEKSTPTPCPISAEYARKIAVILADAGHHVTDVMPMYALAEWLRSAPDLASQLQEAREALEQAKQRELDNLALAKSWMNKFDERQQDSLDLLRERAVKEQLLAALRIYADPTNWVEGNDWVWIGDEDPAVYARAAIAAGEKP